MISHSDSDGIIILLEGKIVKFATLHTHLPGALQSAHMEDGLTVPLDMKSNWSKFTQETEDEPNRRGGGLITCQF